MSTTLFTLPEQIAIAEVLHLITSKQIEIVNLDGFFFSRIDCAPLKKVTPPDEPSDFAGQTYHYIDASVDFSVRGKPIARTLIRGQIVCPQGIRVIDLWRTIDVHAREYFWRGDEDERRNWKHFEPKRKLYGAIRAGTDTDEAKFRADLFRLIM